MHTETGLPSRPGPDWSRRDFLRAASVGGVSVVAATEAVQPSAADWTIHPGFGRARSCLLIFLAGGPSHLDTFDPKPDAPSEIRGEFQPIATSVPGLRFCEHLPGLARRADRFTVVRSMGHSDTSHACAVYRALTGRPYPSDLDRAEHLSREDHPHLGSIVAAAGGLPATAPFVTVPHLLGAPGPVRSGQHAGSLGPEFDPRVVPGAQEGAVTMSELDLAQGLVLGASAARGLRSEPTRVGDGYGRHRFGRSVLQGRRLVEAGVRFVQVNWSPSIDAGWDTHADGFAALKEALLPPTDRAISALLDDLSWSGLLDQTLVVVMGEFGRGPRVTAAGGRGHWPTAYSILLAGAGIPGGRCFGATDRTGASSMDHPVAPESIAATLLFALGVDPSAAAAATRGDQGLPLESGPVLALWS